MAWHLWRDVVVDRRALEHTRAVLRYLFYFPVRSALARLKRPILAFLRRLQVIHP